MAEPGSPAMPMLIVAVSPVLAPRVSEPRVRIPELETPGESAPPLATVTEPAAVPLPARLAPELTVTAEPDASDPVTLSVPLETKVAPV